MFKRPMQIYRYICPGIVINILAGMVYWPVTANASPSSVLPSRALLNYQAAEAFSESITSETAADRLYGPEPVKTLAKSLDQVPRRPATSAIDSTIAVSEPAASSLNALPSDASSLNLVTGNSVTGAPAFDPFNLASWRSDAIAFISLNQADTVTESWPYSDHSLVPAPTLAQDLDPILPAPADTGREDEDVATLGDPDLGILELEPIAPPREPVVFLQGQVTYLSSDNLFLDVDPVGDAFINPRVLLSAVPRLGPNTFFVGSVSAGGLRYFRIGDASYDELGASAGFYQQFDRNTYGLIGWGTQQLYRPGFTNQFYATHNINAVIGRSDSLLPNLQLNSNYQASLGFAAPDDLSRLIQTVNLSLDYDIAPAIQMGVAYQLTLADFTRQERYDTYHQILGQFVYRLTDRASLRLFGGFSFGQSSNPNVQFNDTILGVSVDFGVPLF